MKQLSIIIPAYNVENEIERVLRSINRQINNNIEVIVVDDGSTDNTYTIAKTYESDNVHVYTQNNSGVGSARNRGIEVASGTYIWFVDADDIVDKNAIDILLRMINTSPSDLFLFGFNKQIGRALHPTSNEKEVHYSSATEISEHFDELFTANLLNPLWNKLVSTAILKKHNLRFSHIVSGEDAEFVLHYLQYVQSIQVITQPLYTYVVGSSTSTSHRYHTQFVQEHEQMFTALNEYCDMHNVAAPQLRSRWYYETAMGYYLNIFDSLPKRGRYKAFINQTNKGRSSFVHMMQMLGSAVQLHGIRKLSIRSARWAYYAIAVRRHISNWKTSILEIKDNPGVLPKILVLIIRYGMWCNRVKPRILSIPFKVLYHIFDLLYCKLLLNCDISARATIRKGLRIFHPYGIFINADAVIGENFTCRGQVTIGNKGTDDERDGCPVIGNNVEVGVGAKLIGPITIGSGCSVGANAVVTKSYKSYCTLVGIPAKSL